MHHLSLLKGLIMKIAKIVTGLTLLVSASAMAEPVATPTTTAAAKFNVDMPIEAIAADPKAKAVLDAVFPGMTTHAMYEQFKGMSLKALQPMASDQITDAGIAKLSAELAAIK
jgi:hypothetical protein